MLQELIVLNGSEITIQNKTTSYFDELRYFVLDYGKKLDYYQIDYNKTTEFCMLNNVQQEYPNEYCENILSRINELIVAQQKRINGSKSLEQLKEEKISDLKYARDTEEQSPIEYNGYRWDFDDKAIQSINGAIIALANGGEITWTSADDKEIRGVTADDLRGVISASAVRSNALHVKYRELRERVEQCTTKEQVEAIKW